MEAVYEESEMKYRLSVVLLDTLLKNKLINESEYDELREAVATLYKAPIGLFEMEDKLWKIKK